MSSEPHIYQFATPTQGQYRDYIGSVKYTTPSKQSYNTLIMTKTGSISIEKTVCKSRVQNIYNTVAGYIQIKPFIDQYLESNPDTKTKKPHQWEDNSKKYIDQFKKDNPRF